MTKATLEDGTVIDNLEAYVASHEQYKADFKALKDTHTATVTELEELKASGSDEAVSKWKGRAIESEARNILKNEGVKDVDRILKRLSLEGVDFDDEGALVGFEDKVSEFKKDFPEVFDKKARAASIDAHEQGAVEPETDLNKIQAKALFAQG